MSFWLFKSEPDAISFQSLVDKLPADEEWHGIRNYSCIRLKGRCSLGL